MEDNEESMSEILSTPVVTYNEEMGDYFIEDGYLFVCAKEE